MKMYASLLVVLAFDSILFGHGIVRKEEEHDKFSPRVLVQDPNSQDYLDPNPDVWIVELHPTDSQIASMTSQVSLLVASNEIGNVYEHVFQGFTYHGSDVDSIRSHPSVRAVTRDSLVSVQGQRDAIQSFSGHPQRIPRGIRRIFANTKDYMKQTSNKCFCDAVVAVFDTGIDFDNHVELNVNYNMSMDCSLGNYSTNICLQGQGDDVFGHGTHVAGTIAAIDNAQGVVGVCPGAELWSIKVLNNQGWGYVSWILAGLDYLMTHADKVDVVNMSLGAPGCNKALCDAIFQAKLAGIAFAVAAGNENDLASKSAPAWCEAVMGKLICHVVRLLEFLSVSIAHSVSVSCSLLNSCLGLV